jgi:hypothetical protein
LRAQLNQKYTVDLDMPRKQQDLECARSYDGFDAKSYDGSEHTSSFTLPVEETAPHVSSVRNKAEDKLVRGARVTVIMVLLLAGVAIATLAYVLLSKSEDDSFQSQVCGCKNQCTVASATLESFRPFSDTIASFHIVSNELYATTVYQLVSTSLSHGQ